MCLSFTVQVFYILGVGQLSFMTMSQGLCVLAQVQVAGCKVSMEGVLK